MARGQGPAGRRGPGAHLTRPLFVQVHDLSQARAVLGWAAAGGHAAVPVTAPGMAAFAGVGFWHAVEVALGHPVIIDCADDAGLVLAALRQGARDLLFTGPAAVARKLDSIAGQLGGRIRGALDGELVALLAEDDPAQAVAAHVDRASRLEGGGPGL